MKSLQFILLILSFLLCKVAYADDSAILFDSCISAGQDGSNYTWGRPILTCDRIKNLNEGLQVINMAILPASIALRAPGIKESLAMELSTLGLSFANPAILTVTVVGAVGVASLYFIVKRKTEDCAKEDQEALKRQLFFEMERRYGLGGNTNLKLRILND